MNNPKRYTLIAHLGKRRFGKLQFQSIIIAPRRQHLANRTADELRVIVEQLIQKARQQPSLTYALKNDAKLLVKLAQEMEVEGV